MVRLQFVLGRSVSSRAIAWFGGENRFSHIDSVLPDGSLLGARSDRVGGKPPGVQIRPPNYEPWARKVVMELPSTDMQAAIWLSFLLGEIGKPYDHSLIWGFALGTTFGVPRNWREVDSWICSELAARALEVSGIVPELYVPASSISPNVLAIAASAAHGEVFT